MKKSTILFLSVLFTVIFFGSNVQAQDRMEKSDIIYASYDPEDNSFEDAVINALIKYYPEVGTDEVSREMFKFNYLGNTNRAEYWNIVHNYLPYVIELEKPYGYEEFTIHVSSYNTK